MIVSTYTWNAQISKHIIPKHTYKYFTLDELFSMWNVVYSFFQSTRSRPIKDESIGLHITWYHRLWAIWPSRLLNASCLLRTRAPIEAFYSGRTFLTWDAPMYPLHFLTGTAIEEKNMMHFKAVIVKWLRAASVILCDQSAVTLVTGYGIHIRDYNFRCSLALFYKFSFQDKAKLQTKCTVSWFWKKHTPDLSQPNEWTVRFSFRCLLWFSHAAPHLPLFLYE